MAGVTSDRAIPSREGSIADDKRSDAMEEDEQPQEVLSAGEDEEAATPSKPTSPTKGSFGRVHLSKASKDNFSAQQEKVDKSKVRLFFFCEFFS